MKHELLSKEELALRFRKDVRTITNWVQLGMPQRTRSGRPVFSWEECLAWREEQIRKDQRGLREADGDEDRAKEMAELKLREQRALTERAELDLLERRSQLVPRVFMRAEFERILQAIRTRLLGAPAAWAPRVDAAASLIDRQLVLEDEVNRLMPLLQQAADDDGEDVDDADGGDDPPAADPGEDAAA